MNVKISRPSATTALCYQLFCADILDVKNPLLKNVSLFKRNKKVVAILIALLVSTTIQAQTDRLLVRQGNKQFRAGNYAEAEVSYRKAVEKNPRNAQAIFNLGNALLGQRKDSAAVSQFEQAAKLETNPIRKSQAYHNIGVVNPADDETRYNLELCKRQQQQQNQDQQNQQNKDNKDQKDKDKKDQQKQDQDKKDQQKQDQKQQQQDKQQMSKENAEQMLNAAIQEEKQTQERMKKALQQPNRRSLQKNW